ncbi:MULTISPECIES: hypothetical protein [Mesorhizobium]|uniref:hypothetical protein n=1 Tax=Mesorhizobium TaxID=68287 RepID=UPI000AD1B6C6|nr:MULTISPECIES: hypothetical protein [Mesorhizobium]MCA0002923.1 hypothetical protein [Mesorhizobium sp. B264B2A]MCA0009209.1 hypothetical protein [Mesorhizobium sp. B264B1B]MCA0013990.1 hypothetical protein [Mesorhizobium sp. B294B1A1]MCA0018738.1 hypothetical protein [Mesorhizobium sp. B264B1A]MCA0023253.1 hypothetical protein [Mesorhizobium sp. B263B1A]
MGYKPTRHKPREAALIRLIINGFGGPAPAPLVAIALLATSAIQFAGVPVSVVALLFLRRQLEESFS